MDDLIKSLDNLCAAIEHLAEATTESKQEQAPTAAAIKKGVSGQLLEIMARAANAANDSDDDRSKLGPWVFEGQDPKWQSAAVDACGRAYMHSFPASTIYAENKTKRWESDCFGNEVEPISGRFATDWQNSVIQRQPVNDIDYLTDNDSDHDIAPDVAPELGYGLGITQADLQLIFIKNLSATLIQRMHSMDRFSEDDYAISGANLMPWDIVIYESLDSYAILIDARPIPKISDLLFFWNTGAATDEGWNTDSEAFKCLRTITKNELKDFRAALESSYAN